MVNVVVFHSALGLRPGITEFADELRSHGHVVHTPDLYDRRTFDDVDAGVAERDRIGVPELMNRAQDAVAKLPNELVYAGFSMGTAPAQLLAANDPGARGVVLIQGALGLDRLEIDAWPGSVPIQLHVAADDPWFTRDDAKQVMEAIPDELLDYHEYPIDGHLFADPDLPAHDPEATEFMLRSVTAWLEER